MTRNVSGGSMFPLDKADAEAADLVDILSMVVTAREDTGAHEYDAIPTTHVVDTMLVLPSALNVILSRLKQV